jgi:hypothetical protein
MMLGEDHCMRVRVRPVGAGSRPNDVVVELNTNEGPQRIVIDDKALERGSLSVGYPLRRGDGFVLVALPRQTDIGSFRVWIPAADVLAS